MSKWTSYHLRDCRNIQRSAFWLPLVGLILALGWIFRAESLNGEAGNFRKGSGRKASGAARDLYNRRCIRCHGEDGKGDGERKGALPDFKSRRWQQDRSDAQVLVTILEGKGTRMPAFGGKIQEKEAWRLVSYIRSLRPLRAPKKANPKDEDFDRRFARLLNQFEVLRAQLRKASALPPAGRRKARRASFGRGRQ
jgi:hypothetical protein